ncbi:MAG: hypothetical protein SNJ72_00700 [Fimbriimonadales bacterium]
MNTLLIVLITLMCITLLVLCWAVIALLVQARRQLPQISQRVDEINLRVLRLLDETLPTIQSTHKALDEATRALHEAAETIENLHLVTDNVRHKLEVADEVAGKVRRLPEKTARWLGRLVHYSFKFGGQLVSKQIQKMSEPPRPTVYSVEQPSPSWSEERTRLETAQGSNNHSASETAENASLAEATHTMTEGGTKDAEPR